MDIYVGGTVMISGHELELEMLRTLEDDTTIYVTQNNVIISAVSLNDLYPRHMVDDFDDLPPLIPIDHHYDDAAAGG